MTKGRTFQVKDVARIAKVTVRALHYYDEIGLLTPSGRTEAGYRLYTEDDLLRLQQILVWRELGMKLEQINRTLDDPNFDRLKALETQREELAARAERTSAMLRAIDVALEAMGKEGGRTMAEMSKDELRALFDGFDPSEYEEEVQERWGNTEAFKESARRTSRYTKEDWKRYKAESAEIMKDAAKLYRSGAPAEGEDAMAVAERHRLSIDRWFYPCGKAMHAGLADLYESDDRFAKSIDAYAAGLTPWWSAAIRANARSSSSGG